MKHLNLFREMQENVFFLNFCHIKVIWINEMVGGGRLFSFMKYVPDKQFV